MKTLNTYIEERLVLSKDKPTYTLFPETREELYEMVEYEIKKNGNECSLNHIDVSKITDMSKLFYKSDFNGDISNWDVSNVKDMGGMFRESEFNGDISGWDVSKVKNMNVMFDRCPLQNNPPKWYKEK